jgi:predicted RNase H-like HicB family nuclease
MSREHPASAFPFIVHPDPEGGYAIVFPDLPGCMTQVERPEEIGPAAEEIRALRIEAECGAEKDIPLPSYPEELATAARTTSRPGGGGRAQR